MPVANPFTFRAAAVCAAALLVAVAVTAAPAAELPPREGAGVRFLDSGRVLPEGLPFSEAVEVGDLLLLSGQIGVEPGTMKPAEGGLAAQSRQALANIRTTLEAHGYTMRDVAKCTIMLEDIAQWAAFNEVWKEAFEAPYPARSAFGTSGLALGAAVEIECIAVRNARAGATRPQSGQSATP
jgi:2-iminobutanoate/2-iminopropanoate deaminase